MREESEYCDNLANGDNKVAYSSTVSPYFDVCMFLLT